MKEKSEDFLWNERGNNLVRRFEKMRKEGTFRFMDVSDYEEVINTYMDKGQLKKPGRQSNWPCTSIRGHSQSV